MFAWEHSGAARPDLMCLSKGITGGHLPLSCVLASDDIYGAFYDDDVARGFLHSHSYTGNPLACAAAVAVLDPALVRLERGRLYITAANGQAIYVPVGPSPIPDCVRFGRLYLRLAE
jgi:adenosylmethionine-8-amino-7-oxononanoate aminotransferase